MTIALPMRMTMQLLSNWNSAIEVYRRIGKTDHDNEAIQIQTELSEFKISE